MKSMLSRPSGNGNRLFYEKELGGHGMKSENKGGKMKICKYCETENDSDAVFCINCGASDFKNKCANCGAVYEGNFCPQCGTKAGRAQKTCPKCGELYTSYACPSCGYTPGEKKTETVVHYVPTESKGTKTIVVKQKKKSGCLIFFLILLGISFLSSVCSAASFSSSSSKATATPPVRASAKATVKNTVKPTKTPIPSPTPEPKVLIDEKDIYIAVSDLSYTDILGYALSVDYHLVIKNNTDKDLTFDTGASKINGIKFSSITSYVNVGAGEIYDSGRAMSASSLEKKGITEIYNVETEIIVKDASNQREYMRKTVKIVVDKDE